MTAKASALPAYLIILGRKWSVTVEEEDLEEATCFGKTDTHAQTITIYARPHELWPARGTQWSTLFHEAIHATLQVSGVGALLPGGKEEAVCVAMEHGLWPVVEAFLGAKR